MKAASATESKRKAWKEVKQGSVIVKIYKGTTRAKRVVDGRVEETEYPVYTLAYYDGPKRVRLNFGSAEKALAKADEVKIKLANGEASALKLTSHDRAMLVQSEEMLKRWGKPVNLAVSEYVDAISRLPEGVTLARVVDAYLERHKNVINPKTVREVVDELIAAKEDARKTKDERRAKKGEHLSSTEHVDDLRSRLGAFAAAFQMNIGDVTWDAIQRYIDGLKTKKGANGKERSVSGRTKGNHLRHIASLMRFATRRKYVPKELIDELDAIEKPEDDETDIQIFTPEDIQLMFEVVRAEMVPWLAIAAFAGLRSAELARLDWKDIDLAERYIEVTAAKAKTGSRRLVPISDNLMQWLLPSQRESGRLTPFQNMGKQLAWLVDAANAELESTGKAPKFEWKRNGLRHSFISYRLAILKDVGAVSLEAGNSAQMIFKHYRQLVTEAEAKKWFSVIPPAADKVIALPSIAPVQEQAMVVNGP